MQNYIGQYIDRYCITERLGIGGMAVVYKAYDTRLERDVALKLIRTEAIPAEQRAVARGGDRFVGSQPRRGGQAFEKRDHESPAADFSPSSTSLPPSSTARCHSSSICPPKRRRAP